MSVPRTKADLLALIESERGTWDKLLAEIGEARMATTGAAADWTFKDVVAHLNGWRQRTINRLEAARAGVTEAPPPWPAHFNDESEAGTEQINQWLYEQNRDRPLRDVLAESRTQFDQMRDTVQALSCEELQDPSRFPWLDGEPLGANLFTHFHEEHESDIQAWLAK